MINVYELGFKSGEKSFPCYEGIDKAIVNSIQENKIPEDLEVEFKRGFNDGFQESENWQEEKDWAYQHNTFDVDGVDYVS